MNIHELLRAGELHVEGRLLDASNATLRCVVGDDVLCVYKPLRGERPLWDFPNGTLTGREVASYLIDQALGFDLVPPTVWRDDGPAGPGMCQLWVHEDESARLIDVVDPNAVPPTWRTVLQASDGVGHPVVLVHADDERLQRMAVFDAIVNNGDRKGGHIITDLDGHVWGVDHGVTLSVEPKLRTVLWGWAGEPIPEAILASVHQASSAVDTPELARWLDPAELDALRQRIAEIVDTEMFPLPGAEWPAIPWPVF
jgi:uncharacterized repeat protein (TIGR03843 family)